MKNHGMNDIYNLLCISIMKSKDICIIARWINKEIRSDYEIARCRTKDIACVYESARCINEYYIIRAYVVAR